MLRSIIISLLVLHSGIGCPAQAFFTLSGAVTDGGSGELLIGASVSVPALGAGVETNEYGFYALTLPAHDSLVVEVSYVGFPTQRFAVFLVADRRLDVELSPGVALNTVLVRAGAVRERLTATDMSVDEIDPRDARLLPVLLGESDVLKAIQLKPGIPSGAEGTTGLFVRGGAADQNLIVLDEAVVYNANHLFGFFSTFNTDAVRDLKIHKGGFPAQYGGRLSSVIDVKLKEGNSKSFSGAGGLGLLASRLTLEGPLARDRASFMVSGRRTYIDLFTRLINRANAANPGTDPIPDYFFYDLNTKLNVRLGERDRVFLSGYFGRDVFGFNDDFFDFNFDWGNATGTARWNHFFSPRLFANTTATFSNYRYNILNRITGFSFRIGSRIQDANLKTDFYYAPNNRHTIRFGANLTAHAFRVGRLAAGSDDGSVSFSAGQTFAGQEFGLYLSDDVDWSERFSLQAGLRLSGFHNDGRTYLRAEPRLATRLSLNDRLSLKGSYARMYQYLHLVANAGVTLPTDVWFPSTANIPPQRSDQVALGLSYLAAPSVLISWETYYKYLDKQVEFIDGARLFVNDDLEAEFAIGRGKAYGAELAIEKTDGRLRGWIGYTLALTRRGDFRPVSPEGRFLQSGFFFPIYDRRHDLSVVALWDIGRRLTASLTFVYGSGDLRWLPTGRFTFQDVRGGEFNTIVPHFQERNNYRLPPYHRLDLGLVIRFFPRWGENDLTIGVINAYDRRNTFFIYLEPKYREVQNNQGAVIRIPERIAARQVSLFPVLPSITWNFKF